MSTDDIERRLSEALEAAAEPAFPETAPPPATDLSGDVARLPEVPGPRVGLGIDRMIPNGSNDINTNTNAITYTVASGSQAATAAATLQPGQKVSIYTNAAQVTQITVW